MREAVPKLPPIPYWMIAGKGMRQQQRKSVQQPSALQLPRSFLPTQQRPQLNQRQKRYRFQPGTTSNFNSYTRIGIQEQPPPPTVQQQQINTLHFNRAPPPQPRLPPSTHTSNRFQPFIDNYQCYVDTEPPPTTNVHVPSPSVTLDRQPRQIRTRTFTSNTRGWTQQRRTFPPQRTQPWQEPYQHKPQRRKPVVTIFSDST
ncbi:unnamed protein product, partial [Didymodactylos carnosus]